MLDAFCTPACARQHFAAANALATACRAHPFLITMLAALGLLALAPASMAPAALAQSKTWNGSVSSDWHTASNWTPAGVPGPADTVLIPTGVGTVSTSAYIEVASADIRRPITIGGIFTSTITLSSEMTLAIGANIQNSTLRAQLGCALISTALCSAPARLNNLVIIGHVPTFAGFTVWSNVVLNGTITATSQAGIVFDGDQTLSGGLISAPSASLQLGPYIGATVLTVAEGASVRGENVLFSSTNGCGLFRGAFSVRNLGTIEGTTAGLPVTLRSPVIDSTGLFLGAVRFTSDSPISNSTLSASGAAWQFPAACGPGVRLHEVTIDGDVPAFNGHMRWSNVTVNGTLTATTELRIAFEVSQTFSGTIVGAPGSATTMGAESGAVVLTVAPGAAIRGENIVFASGNPCGSAGASFTLANHGTLEGTSAVRPLQLFAGLSAAGALRGAIRLRNTVDLGGGPLNLAPGLVLDADGATIQRARLIPGGGALILAATCSTPTRFSDLVIDGNLPAFSGIVRWNNVTLNGTITATASTWLLFEGNQTLTGTVVNAASSTMFLASYQDQSILTIGAQGAVLGENVVFLNANPCGRSAALTVANLGTIQGIVPARPIEFRCPVVNSNGSFLGALRFSLESPVSDSVMFGSGASWQVSTACSPATRFTNVTINGNVAAFNGHVRWDNITVNGSLTSTTGLRVAFLGNQVLTGSLINSSSNAMMLGSSEGASALTISAGAVVRGDSIIFINANPCGIGTATLTLSNQGTIQGTVPARPISINAPLMAAGTLRGSIRFNALIDLGGGTMALEPGFTAQMGAVTLQNAVVLGAGGALALPPPCSTPARLSNVTIAGDIPAFNGHVRWNGVSVNGTLTATTSLRIAFEGNQTLTGTLINAAPNAMQLGGHTGTGLLTIAPTATVRGDNIRFISANPCSGSASLSLVNRGTIDGTVAARPVALNLPSLNLGNYIGAVTSNGQQYSNNWTVAQPNQIATATAPRSDPGSGSTQTLTFQDLYVAPGVPFALGSGETLNLNNGTGTLYITQGSIFTGNGVINGNIYNAGLLIIPISRAGIIANVSGPGVVRVAPPEVLPPPQTPVVISPTLPPVVRSGSLLSVGGSGVGGSTSSTGGGGGGGSGTAGRVYQMATPQVVVQGGATWDGRLEVTGTYTQTETGVMRLFIAGDIAGETYSQLVVGQGITLGGTLQIVFQPELLGFTPAVGSTYDFVVATTGGITLPPEGLNGLQVQTLMTAQGANELNLPLAPFNSGFAGDPNSLVSVPSNLFSLALVNGPSGTTILRATMTGGICVAARASAGFTTCPGVARTLSVTPLGSGPFTYQWRKRATAEGTPVDITDDGRITGAQGATLSFNPVQAGDSGFYDCIVTRGGTCGASITTPVRVFIGCDNPSNVASPGQGTTCDDELTADDIIVFVGWFFNADPRADVAGSGQIPTPDGQFTADDIIVFVNRFFAGC